jgi:NAD(P)-dependent dehydrogenase (short-subunit alcohol dehydrogenase family)
MVTEYGGPSLTRAAIVTGAASGIGAAVTAQLLSSGARVAGIDLKIPAVAPDQASDRFLLIEADLRFSEQARAAVGTASEWLGQAPDALVQSAGVYRARSLLECDEVSWDSTFAVNVRAVFLIAQAVVARRRKSNTPLSIVNIASTAAVRGYKSEPAAAYNASKAALLALTRQMALEWADLGVRANAVLPGFTDTPMVRVMDDPSAGQATLDHLVPLQRMGQPEEVAETVCFLLSPRSSYTTGAEVAVDGGLLLSLS